MSAKNIFFEEQFKIRASEIGPNQKATLPAICSLLQEVAGNHARQLEFDITDLQDEKMTWVLHRLHVDMDRFPDWRENITIRTRPSGGDGLRAFRDFLILDKNEDIIGRSLSYWLILDMKSRRPRPIPQQILDWVPDNVDHVLPLTKPNFAKVEQPNSTQQFTVRKTDLDLNNHLNNVRYIEWALSCLPSDLKVSNICIKFEGEAILSNTVLASYTDTPNRLNFQLKRPADDTILARAFSK